MATIYTKTALKKIKKDELIQMFLDQQAKLNNYEIENEDLKEEYFDKGWEQGKWDTWDEIEKATEDLKAENEKLKGKLQDIKDHYDLGHLADEWQMNDDFSITL